MYKKLFEVCLKVWFTTMMSASLNQHIFYWSWLSEVRDGFHFSFLRVEIVVYQLRRLVSNPEAEISRDPKFVGKIIKANGPLRVTVEVFNHIFSELVRIQKWIGFWGGCLSGDPFIENEFVKKLNPLKCIFVCVFRIADQLNLVFNLISALLSQALQLWVGHFEETWFGVLN